jgi:WXG100 family type VII secretion target
MEQLDRRLSQQVGHMQNGGWVGKGADAFYTEIDQIIHPALRRLHVALCEAQNVTLQISQVMQQAEEEAANLFQGSESPFIISFPGSENGIGMSIGPENSGPFRIGPPQRPDIQHDNGFLDIMDFIPCHLC